MNTMFFGFESAVAQRYGVDEAIFLHNLYYWTFKNRGDARHWHDGRCWTYNSAQAFSRRFPFWSRRQIERIIASLKAQGAIHIGCYNAAGYDRTRWYALDQTVLSIYADTDFHFTEPDSPFPDPVPAIPKRNPKHTPKGKPKDGVLSKQDGKGRYEDGKENDGGHPLRYGRIL